MHIAIIGVGLMGGSLAMSLKDNQFSTKIVGVDASPSNCKKALELGLVDEIGSFEKAIEEAQLIVLATPVDTIPILAVKVLNKISPNQIVMDIGSVKEELSEMICQHPKRGRFVATHPMWGTEKSGPEWSVKGAFKGRTVVICDPSSSDKEALDTVEKLYTTIGMPVSYMTSEEQDLHSAYISHISHVSAYALALTVLEKEREEDRIFELASAGFESTVRLAKSSSSMWVPIFLQNKYNLLDVLREHIHQLQIFRKMLENDDREGLTAVIDKANTIKRIIP